MTTATATRRPTAKTMRACITASGKAIKVDATSKQVVAAWEQIGSPRKVADVVPATPAAKTATAPAAPKPAKAPANCGCGCGQPTITSKATFLAGHDARHAGSLGRGLAADGTDADLVAAYNRLTPALKVKVDRIRETAKRKHAAKQAVAVAKAAYDQALADALA